MFKEFNNLIKGTKDKEIQGFQVYPEYDQEWNIILHLSICDEHKINGRSHFLSLKMEFSIDAEYIEFFMKEMGAIIKNNIKKVNKDFCSLEFIDNDIFFVLNENNKVPLYMNNHNITLCAIPGKDEHFMPRFNLYYENGEAMIDFNLDNYNPVHIRSPKEINFETLKDIYETHKNHGLKMT